jgi:hypothetical protein
MVAVRKAQELDADVFVLVMLYIRNTGRMEKNRKKLG